jgi:peptidoglycan/LPS O-acetylase OafA/YrhL
VPRWRRLDGVDLLRGGAISFVSMNHVNMRLLLGHVPYGQSLPHQMLSTLVWSAQYGVQIFFAVSGFLITSASLRRWGFPAGVGCQRSERSPKDGVARILALHLGRVMRA